MSDNEHEVSSRFNQAKQYHQEGFLQDAQAIYQAILDDHPEHAMSWHMLGVLHAQKEDFEQAKNCISKAIDIDPNQANYNNHLGNILKSLHEYEQAEQCYLQAIKIDKQFIDAYNNLANLYCALQQFEKAQAFYEKALKIDNEFLDAHYNLGTLLLRLKKNQEAIEHIKFACDHYPNNSTFLAKLGVAYLETGELEKAVKVFHEVLELEPQNPIAHQNLGAYYLEKKEYKQAHIHYEKLLPAMPYEPLVSYNLALIATELGDFDEAVNYYQAMLTLDPESVEAHINLANVYLQLNLRKKVLEHYRKALMLQPDNNAVQYLVAALENNQSMMAAPQSYVRNLFDNYADHYDENIINLLHCRVPVLLREAVTEVLPPPVPENAWRLLDIGCGTGLSGEVFKSQAKELIGIDVSEKMLVLAKEKNIYDLLIEGNLPEALSTVTGEFDGVIAGDVFTYIGDLQKIFSRVVQLLKPAGWFAFSIEHGDHEFYRLNDTGRFSHGNTYISQLADAANFDIAYHNKTTIREQAGEPVAGDIYVLTLMAKPRRWYEGWRIKNFAFWRPDCR